MIIIYALPDNFEGQAFPADPVSDFENMAHCSRSEVFEHLDLV